jgi:DNA (cytosine-5)-methyltransferase 1
MKPTALSLFCGCGGSDLGLKKAGFQTVLSNDCMEYAKVVFEANFPDTEFALNDIHNIRSFPSVDLLVGCYPCQGFSQGGLRESDRKINYLYREFDRALRLIRPKAFIVENVSGMLLGGFKKLLNNQVTRFRMAGYRVPDPQVLDASDYGVPQTRKRIFIVGIRSDQGVTFTYPNPTHGLGTQKEKVSQKDALKGMPEWPIGEFNDEPFHWYYLSRNRRREWDKPCATIVANQRHIPLHPISPILEKIGEDQWVFSENKPARRFSFKESAILQGFPKDFIFPNGSLEKKYTVIGNAVPPPLFEVIVKSIPDIW